MFDGRFLGSPWLRLRVLFLQSPAWRLSRKIRLLFSRTAATGCDGLGTTRGFLQTVSVDCKFLFQRLGRIYKPELPKVALFCPVAPDSGLGALQRVWHGMCITKKRSRDRSCIEPGARKGWNRFRRSLAESLARYRRGRTRPEQGRTVILVASNVRQPWTQPTDHRTG